MSSDVFLAHVQYMFGSYIKMRRWSHVVILAGHPGYHLARWSRCGGGRPYSRGRVRMEDGNTTHTIPALHQYLGQTSQYYRTYL